MPTHAMTTIELAVIALSRRDPPSSLNPPGHPIFRLLGAPFHPPLARPQLEALRRYAILRRLLGDRLPDDERDRIRDAGYDPRRIDALVAASIAPGRRGVAEQTGAEQDNSPSSPESTISSGHKTARLFMPLIPNVRPGLIAAAVLSSAFWSSSGLAQETNIAVGVGAIYAPAYQGADDYRVMPVPLIDVTWGPLFANFRDGIGVKAFDTGAITAGVGVTFMPGYRRKDAPAGIGKLSAGAGARAFLSMDVGGFTATIGATKGFAGNTKGVIVDASLSYPISVSPRLMLIPAIEATWADGKHNDRYFGVDAAQSLASGLPRFRAGSGFKDASALLNLQYRLTDRMSLGVSGGATTLLGKVQDSPIVYHKTQALGFFSLSYRFGS